MLTPMTLLIVVIVLLITRHFLKEWKYYQLPSPGLQLPIIGHLYLLMGGKAAEGPVNAMWDLYKKYQKNGMMFLRLFKMNMMLVGDYDTLKEIYNNPNVQGRLAGTGMEWQTREERMLKSKEIPGVILSEGRTWVEQRRFTLRTLRDFGFGKQGMEEMIQEEVDMFKALINKSNGEPFDFMNKLNLPILNALWRVTVGERFEYDNPRLLSIVRRLTEAFEIFGNPSQALLIAYPWLAKIIPSFFDMDHTDKVFMDVIDLMTENIMKHKETLDPNEPRDFTDMMLIEIEQTTDKTSSMYGQLGMDNLKVTLFDLFLAGSETISTTLTWAALYMVRYPEVQRKVQEELDEVVGLHRMPSMKDKPELPYTEV